MTQPETPPPVHRQAPPLNVPAAYVPTVRIARNTIGTAGFVVGLIGLVFSPIPLVGVIAWPLVIVGITLSVVGIARARKASLPIGLAIAGVVCSTLGLIICFVWLVGVLAAQDSMHFTR